LQTINSDRDLSQSSAMLKGFTQVIGSAIAYGRQGEFRPYSADESGAAHG
jgi:hypothetical protein